MKKIHIRIISILGLIIILVASVFILKNNKDLTISASRQLAQVGTSTSGTSTALLTIKKIVSGGTALPSSFQILINGSPVAQNTPISVPTGTSNVSEVSVPGYTATYGVDCNSLGNVTLALGDSKLCSVTNTYSTSTSTSTSTKVFAVGYNGDIRVSSNDGQTMTVQNNPWSGNASFTYKGVSFPNTQNGWVVGKRGYNSCPSGYTYNPSTILCDWSSSSSTVSSIPPIANIDGHVVKTNNAGTSWVNQFTATNYGLNAVYFTNSFRGWVVGQKTHLYRTTNGGVSWNLGSTTSFSPTVIPLEFTSVHFPSSFFGYVVGQKGIIAKSTNGGSSLILQTSGTIQDLNDVYCRSTSVCYVVGENNTILRTTNGGTNWFTQTSPLPANSPLKAVHFINSTTGWITGLKGGIGVAVLKTTNGGITWTIQALPVTLVLPNDIQFRNATNGITAGLNGDMYTNLGGVPWIVGGASTIGKFNSVDYAQ